ncbi:hypothetical protein VE04_05401 [Pseudogymnoascus sp. 24MN13]|nr:hypothetical protein VE04_05401 [Pseudogymnoascus sp. 24MN13]
MEFPHREAGPRQLWIRDPGPAKGDRWRAVPLDAEHIQLTLEKPPSAHGLPRNVQTPTTSAPVFYKGSSNVKSKGDTFLELPGSTKGVVWANGIILGRYRTVGLQQQLNLPGDYLKKRNSETTVLVLEPNGNQAPAKGIQVRSWSNNPDPDAL